MGARRCARTARSRTPVWWARDAYRGETVKAFVVLKGGNRVTKDEIIQWAREKMAAFKVPRLVEFVDELPRTATGKVFWRKLQEEENRK